MDKFSLLKLTFHIELSKKIIDSKRDYSIQLLERAKELYTTRTDRLEKKALSQLIKMYQSQIDRKKEC